MLNLCDFFSIAMCANYSLELNSIVHWVSQFIGHTKIFLGSVHCKEPEFQIKSPTVLLGTVHCSAVFQPFLLKEEVGRENQVNHEEKKCTAYFIHVVYVSYVKY